MSGRLNGAKRGSERRRGGREGGGGGGGGGVVGEGKGGLNRDEMRVGDWARVPWAVSL